MKAIAKDLTGASVIHCRKDTAVQRTDSTFGLIQLISRNQRVSTYVNDIDAFSKQFFEATGYKVKWECGPALYFYYLSFEKHEFTISEDNILGQNLFADAGSLKVKKQISKSKKHNF